MTAAALGRAASIAAKEPVDPGPIFWTAVRERAHELLPSMDTEDMAVLLHSLSKVRHVDEGLQTEILGSSCQRLRYFSTRHLTMLLAALARLGVPMDAVEEVLKEFRERISELQGAGLLAMAAVSLSKLPDRQEIVRELAVQVDLRLSADRFHTRDIATVAMAYIRSGFLEAAYLSRLAITAQGTLHEATPRELAGVVLAAATSVHEGEGEAATAVTSSVSLAANLAREQLPFMLPAELVVASGAFGRAFAAGLGGEDTEGLLTDLVARAAEDATQLRLSPAQLASVLQSCARWCLPARPGDLSKLAEAVGAHSKDLPATHASRALQALQQLPVTSGLAEAEPEVALAIQRAVSALDVSRTHQNVE